jgi:hypothetical protein
MKNIDKLKGSVDFIKTFIYQLDYKENDVRKAYFENLYSIIDGFYLGKVYFEISTQIKNRKINIIGLKPHVLRIYEVADHPLLTDSFHNELNRKLFIDSFTNFETTIDLCFDNLKTDEILKKIITDLNSKLVKLINECGNKDEIINQLMKNTFIPLMRKFKFLAKRQKECYGKNYNQDIKFIDFCTKLRNCLLHSSGYYKGKDFEFEFDSVKFIFIKDEFLEIKGENDYIFLKISENLTNIAMQVFNCFKDIDYLKYPDDGF